MRDEWYPVSKVVAAPSRLPPDRQGGRQRGKVATVEGRLPRARLRGGDAHQGGCAMRPQRHAGAVVGLTVSLLLLAAGPSGAYYPLAGGRIHVGPDPNPPPWVSDNGNPGNALPIYEGYNWPSLREA